MALVLLPTNDLVSLSGSSVATSHTRHPQRLWAFGNCRGLVQDSVRAVDETQCICSVRWRGTSFGSNIERQHVVGKSSHWSPTAYL